MGKPLKTNAAPSRVHGPGHVSRGNNLDHLIEVVLSGAAGSREGDQAHRVLSFNARETRTVILGGGTGLSTVVGGNSQSDGWAMQPFVGLKQEFSRLDVVVCTTDDGGSTGRLLKQLPMIGIGDIRKSFVSLIRLSRLQEIYGFSWPEALAFVHLVQRIFHFRFGEHGDPRILENPLLAAPASLREVCPRNLEAALRSLGRFISPGGDGPTISTSGHSLGNLLLTSAIFRAAGGDAERAPRMKDIYSGLSELSDLVGVAQGSLHPATVSPGQLKFRYANGVEVCGQSKSAQARRDCPVERLVAEFAQKPVVSAAVIRAIRNADLILYAPGSLYTSIIPILQLAPIVEAIRGNHRAMKILAANFWIQEGETDTSLRQAGQGFLVSDLIEAYDRNVPGGAHDLFDIVLSANLARVPGSILRNYALEGKSPIHLDRKRLEAMGYKAVESTLFNPDFRSPAHVIHHDPERFALTIRTLLYAWNNLDGVRQSLRRRGAPSAGGRALNVARGKPGPFPVKRRSLVLSRHVAAIARALENKDYQPGPLKEILADLAWENRDIRPAHLACFRSIRVIPAAKWNRSTAWDNVLGYYDPRDRGLKLHEKLLLKPARLREDLLIALGESLLGRYIESRTWHEKAGMDAFGARCYEIRLRPARERECFLNSAQLARYLELARMVPDSRDPAVFRITLNDLEGFLPPGLLFGLTYAWYLNNSYAAAMDCEMSLLRWPARSLIPHQAKERVRRQALVEFFRAEVFGHERN